MLAEDIERDEDQKEITDEIWKTMLKGMKLFKAAGPNFIKNHTHKVVPEAGRLLKCQVEGMSNNQIPIPLWLVRGRTWLVHKGGKTEDEANYRPIACLNTAYKAMTTVVAMYLGGSLCEGGDTAYGAASDEEGGLGYHGLFADG